MIFIMLFHNIIIMIHDNVISIKISCVVYNIIP